MLSSYCAATSSRERERKSKRKRERETLSYSRHSPWMMFLFSPWTNQLQYYISEFFYVKIHQDTDTVMNPRQENDSNLHLCVCCECLNLVQTTEMLLFFLSQFPAGGWEERRRKREGSIWVKREELGSHGFDISLKQAWRYWHQRFMFVTSNCLTQDRSGPVCEVNP